MNKLTKTDNARNMSPKQTLDAFVINDSFIELTKPNNCIVLGSRGSGKTQLLKMLSFGLMSKLDRNKIPELPGVLDFIGIYVPLSAFWAGDVKNNRLRNDKTRDSAFIWRVNLASSLSFLESLACLLINLESEKNERILKEREISRLIYKSWFFKNAPDNLDSINDLISELNNYDRKRQAQERRMYFYSDSNVFTESEEAIFDCDLFVPILAGRDVLDKKYTILKESNWVVCLDEAEFLDESLQKIINTSMRSHIERLFIKMSTFPFGHYTLETNTCENISSGHDFKYLYIDYDCSKNFETTKQKKFVFQIIRKHYGNQLELLNEIESLDSLLGHSPLITSDDKMNNNFEELINIYADSNTQKRAACLRKESPKKYENEIVRKMRGLLKLMQARDERKGNTRPSVYFGSEIFIRCTDANPRRILELFSLLCNNNETSNWPINEKIQNKSIRDFSKIVLDRSRIEEGIGEKLFQFINQLCESLSKILDEPISSDVVYSVNTTKVTDESLIRIIKKATNLGLLYPNDQKEKPDNFSYKGVFHPAYVLAPYFYLYPRKGRSKHITSLLNHTKDLDETQLRLF